MNRKGFNCHALVLSGCGFPLQIMFQETGHTILDIVIGLLSGAFGFDASTTPDLSNWIVFKADRQYSRKGLIIWAQRTGLDLLMTLMRQHFIPLTYGKPDATKQYNIVPKQAACTYTRTLTHNFGQSGKRNNKVTVVGWRNGISSTVTLMLTTEMHEVSYDLVFANPADLNMYRANLTPGQRQMSGFTRLCGADDPDTNIHIADEQQDTEDDQPEKPSGHIMALTRYLICLTHKQLCLAWWILRVFCLTSSTTSCLIKLFAKQIGADHPRREDFETVLRYTGNLELLPIDDNVSENDSTVGGDGTNEDEGEDGCDTGGALNISDDHKSLFRSILERLESSDNE